MDKTLRIAIVLILSIVANNGFAQDLPNGDFEDIQSITRLFPNGNDSFTYDSIGGPWLSGDEIKKDINIIPDPGQFAKDTSWTYSGSHAIVMRTMEIQGLIATGNLGIGTYDFDDINPFNSIQVGIPFTHKPIKLRGYYDFTTVANDSCWISIFFSKWNTTTMARDTIGYGEFVTNQNTNDTYTLFEIPINYTNTDVPDTMGILMVSSKGGFEVFPPIGQVGTTLIVDSCSFVYDYTGISENSQELVIFESMENFINIKVANNELLTTEVYDVSGKLIEKKVLTQGDNHFYLPKKQQVYMFRINGTNFNTNKKMLF